VRGSRRQYLDAGGRLRLEASSGGGEDGARVGWLEAKWGGSSIGVARRCTPLDELVGIRAV
jgi:hypothetical protein